VTNSARLVGPRAHTPSAKPSNFLGEIWLQIPSAREHQQQNDAIERRYGNGHIILSAMRLTRLKS
jgi:hypothetical protein